MSTDSTIKISEKLAAELFDKPLVDFGNILPASLHEWPDGVLLFSRKEGFPHDAPSHHDRFVLVLTLRGQGEVLLDGRMLTMPEKSALLIFPYQFHHFIRTDSPKLSWLFITFEMDRADNLLPLQNGCVAIPEGCWQEIERIVRDFRHPDIAEQVKSSIVSARLQIVMSLLLAGVPVKKRAAISRRHSPNQAMYDVIRQVAETVSDNLHCNFSVDDAADEVGVSASYLQKIFHTVLGFGVGTYIRRHKVLHAARLLKATDKTVSEISSECGFESLYSFSRTFKTIMQMSPRAFRNRSI